MDICANNSFNPLTEYLSQLEQDRAAAIAASLSIPSGTEKRPAQEKLEESGEKKKKVKVSQGVRNLEKVSTRGMKDVRSFFNKKPIKAKA